MTVLELLKQGIAHLAAERSDEAEACFGKVLSVAPDQPDALHLLGAAKLQKNDYEQARSLVSRAIKLMPDAPPFHNTLGETYRWQGNVDAAIQSYRNAIRLKPDYDAPYLNAANTLRKARRYTEALTLLEALLSQHPNHRKAASLRADTLLRVGRVAEAVAQQRKVVAQVPDDAALLSDLLLMLHYLPESDDASLLTEHRAYAQRFEPVGVATPARMKIAGPLRVALLSPDLGEHPASYFLAALTTHLAREDLELHVLHDRQDEDRTRALRAASTATWHTTAGHDDAHVEGLAQSLQIHVLIEAAGHTAHNRLKLLARRIAPWQISYLGYPGTTGLGTMDARLTDMLCDGAESQAHYSERLIRLPAPFAAYTPPTDAPEVRARTEGEPVRFAACSNLYKMSDVAFDLVCRVLHAVPGSMYRLLADGLQDAGVRDAVMARFAERRIDPDRVELRAPLPFEAYLRSHDEIDLLLDPQPFCGHTVMCHALWMGVPAVTLRGNRFASRLGASVMSSAGLDEFIADDAAGYVSVARRWAEDAEGLRNLRATLRDRVRASALCDGRAVAGRIADALRLLVRGGDAR